uniref:SPFH domain-containing protein n=1 Tax=Thermocrispum agreste TaxID=37925 RepID=A0A2W4JEM7_9PSEU|nr:MAG: SPFH domain-containing protein [Thermocrispum agreste]
MLEVLQFFTGIFVVVYDGQHALKYTLGRARAVVGPGVHFKWPVIQRFRVEETKDTTLDLEPQVIQLQDDLVYEVGAKVVYQIVDLRKALIEVDDLVEGLKNRLTLAVQRVVKAQTRESIRDLPAMIERLREELRPVEEQWGVRIRELGFSNLSPTPPTLEITQLRLLAQEKLDLFQRFTREEGLSEDAAVALISGAVMAVREADRLEPAGRGPAAPPPARPAPAGDAEPPVATG